MKDTNTESKNISKTTPATTQAKNTKMPVIDMEQVKHRLSIVAEDVYQFNARTDGKMSLYSTPEGLLVIVASVPYHRLGAKESSSGVMITIDGEPIE